MSSLNPLIVAALAASALALTLVAPLRSRRLARLRAAQSKGIHRLWR
ncbi:MAG: hypothetical protein JO116_26020 [Planctomycetaceae bacterium]|nr:hypothetical protein [Planctomycetaceae bacterium]